MNKVLDRYELEQQIGVGGAGEVWRATDRLVGQVVAVKLLHATNGQASRTCVEAWAMQRRVPGVVALLDEGTTPDGRPVFVMQYIEGTPFPGRPVPCTWNELRPTALGLLDTVARMHALGIIHRDLKPGNVKVTPSGHAFVLDLGLVRIGSYSDPGITLAGELYGTVNFCAPERAHGEETERGDVYSLGVMLFVALCGSGLDGVESPTEALCLQGVPEGVAAVIARMVSHAPAARPASVQEAADLLSSGGVQRVTMVTSTTQKSEDDLRQLFYGPDPFFARDVDAAQLLFARTGGDPDRVRRELEVWREHRLVTQMSGRLVALPELFERDTTGSLPSARDDFARERSAFRSLPLVEQQVLQWIDLAGLLASPERVANWMAVSHERVRAALEACAHRGDLENRDENLILRRYVGCSDRWMTRSTANLIIARSLPKGEPHRFRFLFGALSTQRPDDNILRELANEAVALSLQLCCQGMLSRAEHVVLATLRLLRQCGALPNAREQLLMRLVEIAASALAPVAFRRVLYELSREEQYGQVPSLLALARAAVLLEQHDSRPLRMLDALRFESSEIEIVRHGLRFTAAQREGDVPLAATWESLDRVVMDPMWRDVWSGRRNLWAGRLAYSSRNYQKAAELAERAAQLEPWRTGRANALLNATAAWMEIGAFDNARRCANEGLELARLGRHPMLNANGTWLHEMIAYRVGESVEIDESTLDAAREVSRETEGRYSVLAAGIAHRKGDDVAIKALWMRVREGIGASGERRMSSLIDALAQWHGLASESEWKHTPVGDPRIDLQVMALRASKTTCDVEQARCLAAVCDAPTPDTRMDVLSVSECLRMIGA
jgi:tetratricopeptide (TPR) repeat protein